MASHKNGPSWEYHLTDNSEKPVEYYMPFVPCGITLRSIKNSSSLPTRFSMAS